MTDCIKCWGPAWNGLRNDVNLLAWLMQEQFTLQRVYMESLFWLVTGKQFPLDEFAAEMGFGVAPGSTTDDTERSAQGALDRSGEGQDGHGDTDVFGYQQSETNQG